MFYSRIPCPKWVDHSEDMLNKATRYFPLVGWIIGLIAGGSYFLFAQFLPQSIAIIFSMAAGILATGAFHEDGFADTCDAFGGGWTKEKILSIMKDSRIGTYGTVGLILILASKFLLLSEIKVYLPIIIFMAHAASRLSPVLAIRTHLYVQDLDSSKSKPIGKQISITELLVASAYALMPLVFLSWMSSWYFLFLLLPIWLSYYFMMRYFKKWIGGYTGDCLGAIQQVSEISIYLAILIISNPKIINFLNQLLTWN